jgi:uncharacterized protein YodC (DUF2158 family)
MKEEELTYSDFAIGRTVSLKSGGNTMTISSAPKQTTEGYRVETTWIDRSGKVCKAWFLIAMLELEYVPWPLCDLDGVAQEVAVPGESTKRISASRKAVLA